MKRLTPYNFGVSLGAVCPTQSIVTAGRTRAYCRKLPYTLRIANKYECITVVEGWNGFTDVSA